MEVLIIEANADVAFFDRSFIILFIYTGASPVNEIQIKISLVASLYSEFPHAVLAAEVPFSYGTRRADIVMLSGNEATGFEIKSEGDKVSRLDYQLESYKDFFDFCYVVCVAKNISSVRKTVPSSFGIVMVQNGEVSFVRRSKHYKRLNKEALASVLSSDTLRKLTGRSDLRSKHELCKQASEVCTLRNLYEHSRTQLFERYAPSMELLKGDVNSVFSPDDIQTITRSAPTELVLRS
ncbi:sce7726 family protein [Marinobacter sp. Arc7-DN-1]|uniref:sce7726 family protein n=1 Tax=Marinobacter sp. Arc7-DN-1 TaxID=2304594 RepID=UPI000E440B84|nr:sce7726 family protein [Marinobacter sp. Arc7-DN-1]AXS83275.1 protein cII [Marinobacter sp. Arc7-DN-1]